MGGEIMSNYKVYFNPNTSKDVEDVFDINLQDGVYFFYNFNDEGQREVLFSAKAETVYYIEKV